MPLNTLNPYLAAICMAFSHKYPRTDAHTSDGSPFTLMQFVEYRRENPSSQPTEHLTGAIRLPLPRSVPDAVSFQIDQENLDLWGTTMEQLNALPGMLIDNQSRLRFMQVWKLLRLYLPGLSDSALGMQMNRYEGVVKNPHTTAIFQGVNLKRAMLSWRFSPRSQADATEYENIIRTLKERIHPELGTGGFALEYPDQVYVTFPNTKLTPIRKSFIVDYSITPGAGNISLYKGGSVVENELNLSFLEVDIITRNELQGRSLTDPDSPQAVIPTTMVDDSPVNALSPTR